MTKLRVLLVRLAELFRLRSLDREFDEEVESHLDMLTDAFVRQGLPRDAARAAARREFGGIVQTREAVRDRRGFRVFDAVAQDVRLAGRWIRQAPAFTATVVVTLALGIGANAAIFSLVDAVLLRPLPYPAADRLVAVTETIPERGGPDAADGDASIDGRRTAIAVAPANLADYAERAREQARFGFYMATGRTVTGAGDPERLNGEEISAGYLEVLGVLPAVGRTFSPDEFAEGANPVVIVSHTFWRDRLGAREDPASESIQLNGVAHRVVGVMPEGFETVTALTSPDGVDFLVPAVIPDDVLAGRGEHIVRVIGRLSGEATISALEGSLSATAAGIAASDAGSAGLGVSVAPLDRVADDEEADPRLLLVVLLSGVGLVLLAACANVASLFVVRAMARRQEVAVRVALGANRRRVLLELGIQTLALTALGTGAGLLLGWWLTGLVAARAPATLAGLDDVTLSWRTLMFTGVISAVTAMIFGALPAWQVSRTQPSDILRSTSRGMTGGWARRSRRFLLGAEVALSMVLLIGAGLMARSLLQLNAVDLGFETSGVVAANVTLPTERYGTPEGRLQFFEAVTERIAATPGVEAVAFANRLPLRGYWASGFEIDPSTGPVAMSDDGLATGFQAVSHDYFDTLRIPVVAGRGFTSQDREGAPAVAVVSEAFLREFLEGTSAIGRRVRRFDGAPWIEIVGVVRDLRRQGRTSDVAPEVYLPAAQTSLYPLRLSEIAVRTTGETAALAEALRSAVWGVDPMQPVSRLRSLDETLSMQQADVNFRAALFVLFAVVTLTLALIGIYGMVSYAVSQRRTEIGLRMALGASAGRVVQWTAAEAAMPLALGGATGCVAAWSVSRHIESQLFGVTPTDPATYAMAAILITATGVAASVIAARRATRVDPASVLR